MEQLIKDATAYLTETTGLEIKAHAVETGNLPVFVAERYAFYTLEVEKKKFLGVVLREMDTGDVAGSFKVRALEQHQRQFPMRGESKGFILIARRLQGFVRKRLIDLKMPFIVPKVQLYWPELGLEYRKRNRERIIEKPKDSLDPATQAVLMGVLSGAFTQTFRPKELAEKLGYSLMSMTRALDRMEAAGFGRSLKQGRERLFTPLDKKRLWAKAEPLFNNPVRDTARLLERDMPDEAKILAGESALAEVSDLVAPQTRTYAVGREWAKKLQEKIIPHLKAEEAGTCAVQIWRYDPALFAEDGMVDVFSLYLSLKDEPDERVQMALDRALKEHIYDNRAG